jgi:hypothetical protein
VLHVDVELDAATVASIAEGHLDTAEVLGMELDTDSAVAGQPEQIRLMGDL